MNLDTPRETRSGSRKTGIATALLSLAFLAGCGADTDRPPPVVVTEVLAVDTPPPTYPIEVACDDAGGEVVLQITIAAEGNPSEVRLVRSSGIDALDLAAHEAVRGWRFKPATRGGQAIPKTIQVPVTFTPPTMRPDRCFALEEQRRRGKL